MKDPSTFNFTADISNFTQKRQTKWAFNALTKMHFIDTISPSEIRKIHKLMLKWHSKWWKWYATRNDGHKTGTYMPDYSRTLAIQEFIHMGFVHKLDTDIDTKAIHIWAYLADLVYPMNFECQTDALKLLESEGLGLQGITGVYLPKTK